MSAELRSERTEVRRRADRASYDRATIDAIIDEAPICHVGVVRNGSPVVVPTIHARSGDTLYLHGSPLAGMMRDLAAGVEACVTITLLDGLVVARSAFHHSMNYRSVVVLGRGRLVDDRAEKLAALEAVVEHVLPGRWAELRAPHAREIAATAVLALPITEASAKIRTGGPIDDDDDMTASVWAGVLPLTLAAAEPVADAALPPGIGVSPSVETERHRRSLR